MNVAIILTGLINEKYETLPHIKRMFDYWADQNNLEIDIYCHFWDSNNVYPYNINYDCTKIKVPKERKESIDYAINVFKPVNSVTSSFVDTHQHFVKFIDMITDAQPSKWHKEIQESITKGQFKEKDIHARYFIDETQDPIHAFNLWWMYHVRWCQFNHIVSQAYTLHKGLRMVINSGKHYDAVIKWRYDLLCDYKTANNKLMNAITADFDNPTYTCDIAWEGLDWTEDFKNINSVIPGTKLLSLADSWFILNNAAIKKMSWHYLNKYVEGMGSIYYGKEGGQHTHCYDGVTGAGVNINLVGRINENIIRFPNTIPDDFHDNPNQYNNYLDRTNFLQKKTSDYQQLIHYWDERSKFYTIGQFDFY